MAGPWEKYTAPAAPEKGPWSKYQQAAPEAPAQAPVAEAPAAAPAPGPQMKMDPLPALVEGMAPGYGSIAGRATFEAAGGAIGTGVGMGASPAGAVVGGLLGTMGGSVAYDSINELIQFAQGKEQLGPGWARLSQTVDNALGAGAFDAGAMGLMRLTAPLGRAAMRGLSGVPEHIAANVARAQQMGIYPTPASVGNRARVFTEATGRLPMAGTTRGPKRITQEVDAAVSDLLNRLGPDFTHDEAANMLAMGSRDNALKVMQNIDGKFNAARVYSARHGNPAVFPAEPMALAAQKYLDEIGQSAVYVGVPRGNITAVDINNVARSNSIEDFMSGMAKMRGVDFTFPQMDALRTTANRLLAKAGPTVVGGPYQDPDGFRAISALKEALRGSQTASRDPQLADLMTEAVAAHSDFKRFINQPALSELRSAIPGIATKHVLEKPRSVEVQNVLDTIIREKSPNVLRNMHALMGDEAFGQVRRRAVMEAFTHAVEPLEEGGIRLHAPKLKELLGLTSREGLQRLEVLLQGSEVKVGDVRRLTEALELVGDQFMPQVSQFMARNLMLRTAGTGGKGGAHGILASMLLGGAGGSAAAGGLGAFASGMLGTLLPIRMLNEAMSSRRVLNSMLKAVEYHKANRPMEQWIRKAMRDWELGEAGYSSPADSQGSSEAP